MVRYIAESEEELQTIQEGPPRAYLSLLTGGRLSHSFPLRNEIRMGREKDNAIVVADQKTSRHHASLTPIETTYIITDLGSANGTYVNGVLIAQPTRLKDNDRVSIGDTTFLYTFSQPDPATLERPLPPVPPSPPQPIAPANTPSMLTSTNLPLWVIVGCMALIIIVLLVIAAVLFGLFIGRTQLVGLIIGDLAWGNLWF